jgi:hypothetical protein
MASALKVRIKLSTKVILFLQFLFENGKEEENEN